ncbi:MAG: molybdate ABC transporter substrate-binding protein [Akkermansiaceae bacterium]
MSKLIKKPFFIFLMMLLSLVALISFLNLREREVNSPQLTVLCAAGLQRPLTEIARGYELSHGVKIRFNFAGSGVLESQLQIAGGHLYLPADESYTEKAQQNGLVSATLPLVELRAVIVVQQGNPKNLMSLADLQQRGIRLSMPDQSAAIGKFLYSELSQSGDMKKIAQQIMVTKPTVNQVIEDVAYGSADATIAWDAVATHYDNVEIVRLDVFEQKPCRVNVGLIVQGREANNNAAGKFMHYLAYDERAKLVFQSMGYMLPKKKGAVDEESL